MDGISSDNSPRRSITHSYWPSRTHFVAHARSNKQFCKMGPKTSISTCPQSVLVLLPPIFPKPTLQLLFSPSISQRTEPVK